MDNTTIRGVVGELSKDPKGLNQRAMNLAGHPKVIADDRTLGVLSQ